ncbi:hypothetical protein CHS0354_038652 [Potamilus streckersoni]|uniref:Mitochondrial ribosomal protein L41 n=1 Tax=Potamilus streckersoni TaxID=2493646 RepID=A0AAE0T8J2_9BIVA|nr:hypothetical protein CHS0354_038652 [Potamilus streckersoni]
MQLLRKNGITWCRNFSMYSALRAIPKPKKASLTPFDKRLTVTGKHVNEHVKGGSRDMQKRVALHVVPPIGFPHPASNQFKKVKEMQPEFVVPDLTDFKLKPYVSYKATPITEPKLTARRLFNSCYAQQVEADLKEGKLKQPIEKTRSDSTDKK